MDAQTFKLKNGTEVTLNEDEMRNISTIYKIQSIADYLRVQNNDWPEQKVQRIATDTYWQMYDYDYTEDEAIRIAIEDYEIRKVKVIV